MSNPRLKVRIVVGLILLAAVFTGVYYLYLYKPEKRVAILTENTGAAFHKEGELTFIDGASGDSIVTIDIEKAVTPEEQEIGLMYRREMNLKQGMLFVGKREEEKGFWMKNTYIALDIIYVNAAKEIVSIGKYAKPRSTETIPSGAPAQYVVEVVAGFCDQYGIGKGDKISF